MKITRRQLRKLILKEFKDTSRELNLKGSFDINDLIGSGGALPPVEPPERGGGGGGKLTPCEANQDGRLDRSFNFTMDAFGTYLRDVARHDEFTYVENLLSSGLISQDDISVHSNLMDFISDGLLYGIALALCEGQITKLDIDAAFQSPGMYLQ